MGELTVANNSRPSSLETPSMMFSSPLRVMFDLVSANKMPFLRASSSASSCSLEGNAQSISSIRMIECAGVEATSRASTESSSLGNKY